MLSEAKHLLQGRALVLEGRSFASLRMTPRVVPSVTRGGRGPSGAEGYAAVDRQRLAGGLVPGKTGGAAEAAFAQLLAALGIQGEGAQAAADVGDVGRVDQLGGVAGHLGHGAV